MKTNNHAPRGTHSIVDGFIGENGNRSRLNDHLQLQQIMEKALRRIGAEIISITSKRFHPQGCTVLAMLAESHASIHTYPEHGVYMIDVFTCGDLQADVAAAYMGHVIGGSTHRRSLRRGLHE